MGFVVFQVPKVVLGHPAIGSHFLLAEIYAEQIKRNQDQIHD
jgi:hypothetical protein